MKIFKKISFALITLIVGAQARAQNVSCYHEGPDGAYSSLKISGTSMSIQELGEDGTVHYEEAQFDKCYHGESDSRVIECRGSKARTQLSTFISKKTYGSLYSNGRLSVTEHESFQGILLPASKNSAFGFAIGECSFK